MCVVRACMGAVRASRDVAWHVRVGGTCLVGVVRACSCVVLVCGGVVHARKKVPRENKGVWWQ